MLNTNIEKSNYLNLIFITLYLLIPFINLMGAIDELGPQWFFLSLLNFATCSYLIFVRNQIKTDTQNIFFNKLNLAYILLLQKHT